MQEILVGSVFLPIMDFMADPVSMMMYVCLVIEGVEAKGHSHDSCKNCFVLSKPLFFKGAESSEWANYINSKLSALRLYQ